MKKIYSILLALCLILLTFSPLNSLANDEYIPPEFISEIRSSYQNQASKSSEIIYDLIYPESGYLYEKYEIKFNINADYDNPFDPDDIAVDCIVTYPSGRTAILPAFYMQEMQYSLAQNTTLMTYNKNSYKSVSDPHWCARFSLDEVGDYSFSIKIVTKSGINQTSLAKKFEILSSKAPGYIDISENNSSYFIDTATGQLFYGSGSNIAWVRSEFTTNPEHLKYEYFLEQARNAGTTLTRVWLCHWAWLEWTPKEGSTSTYSYAGLGYYNQCISSALDNIMSMCEDYGIRLILTLDDNNEHMTSSDPEDISYGGWEYNPYNSANGGPVDNVADYFGNTDVRKYYKNRLRYIIARWGYSSSLMSLNLWNDETQPNDDIVNYLDELNKYTDELTENYRPLLFGSNYRYDANEILDYTTQDINSSDFTKPSVTQECYYSKKPTYFKSTLRNTIWNDFFDSSASTMVWDHDAVDNNNAWDVFTNFLKFVKGVPLHKYKYYNHYTLSNFATTWKSGSSTPTLEIKNGQLHITCGNASDSSYASIKLNNPYMPKNTNSISFYYDATANNENFSDFRITLKTKDGAYMPWYGKTYYFTPTGGETQSKTVSGNSQWTSWMSIPGGQSGIITIPFETFLLDENTNGYDNISNKYKHNIYEETGNNFEFTLQQNGMGAVGNTIKIDNISWCGENSTTTAQNFNAYTSPFAISADNNTSSQIKTVQATALGDIGGWKEKATQNLFYINEDDNNMLLAGISPKLYGSNTNVATYKNDPTFVINCTKGGQMVIQLKEIGSGTNYFEITKNNSQYVKIKLDGGRRLLEENEKYITVPLDAGTNTITLSNSGQDWISITGYYFRFDTDSSTSNALIKRLISNNQQLAYIYNTTYDEIGQSLFNEVPSDIKNVVIPFYELSNAEYTLEIFDTVTGEILTSSTVTPTNNYYEATIENLAESMAIKLTKKLLYGDINSDNTINILDLVRFKKYFANMNVSVNPDLSDINIDGKITSVDLALLRTKILYLEEYL